MERLEKAANKALYWLQFVGDSESEPDRQELSDALADLRKARGGE